MLSGALQLSDMTLMDMTKVPVQLDEIVITDASIKLNTVFTFEPRQSHVQTTEAKMVLDRFKKPRNIMDILLKHKNLIINDGDVRRKLVRDWFRVIDYIRAQPRDAARYMRPREQMSPDGLLATLKGIELLDRAMSFPLLSRSSYFLQVVFRRLQTVMLRSMLVSDTSDVLYGRLAPKVTQ